VAATAVMAPMPPATVPPDETARMVATQPPPQPDRGQWTYIATIIALIVVLAVAIFFLFQLLSGDDTTATTDPTSTTVQVPNLAGEPAIDAVLTLRDLGFQQVSQRDEVSETVPEGRVIATDPPAGASADVNDGIVVIVSSGPEVFTIPNVVNLDLATATERLEANGFTVGEVTEAPSNSVAEGNVIRQDPGPGSAAPGTAVNLEISTGPFSIPMPEVVNKTQENAVQTLVDAGISEDRIIINEEFSNDILEGFVIESDPAAGEPVVQEATVTLLVSLGPEPIPVPNLIGLAPNDARAQVEGLGLVYSEAGERVEVSAESGLDGLVAAQSPDSGELLPGDNIVVSIGALRQVSVPDVIGLTEQEAIDALQEAGFVVDVAGTVEVAPDSDLIGLVAAQNPDADAVQDDGSTVEIFIGVAQEEPPPPDEDE
jgi:serine/threonine-protein kinase